jgi:hypothetical protein
MGYQGNYSVADAATDLWKQDNLVLNLNDPDWSSKLQRQTLRQVGSGQSALVPSEAELTDYIAQLRENGLDGTINWSRFTSELQSLQETEGLSDQIDYLASRYVAVLDKLERNYSGTELTAQKDKLEQVWQSAAQSLTEDYTTFIQDNLGLSDEDADQIQESLEQILQQRVKDCQGNLSQVHDDIVQTGSDSVWLQNHDGYIAARLRETDTTDAGTVYSIQDLTAAGMIAKAYQSASQDTNETMLALDLSMADMKAETMIRRGLVSDEMAELLRNSQDNGHQILLDRLDQYLDGRETTSVQQGNPSGIYSAADRALFQSMYNAVLGAYQSNGGDAVAALRAGVAYGQTATAKASTANPDVQRWGISTQTFWSNFFTTPTFETGSAQWKAAQTLTQLGQTAKWTNSTYQNYVNDWRDFLVSLDGQGSYLVDAQA